VRAKALASTRICTTGAGTAINSREIISAGALVIAASYTIGVRARVMGSKRKWSCSGAEKHDSGCVASQEVGNEEAVSRSSRG
jgi:hypothetical protein